MADKKLYDEKTKTGWKRVEGNWQYFQKGVVTDTGFKGAQDTSREWIKNTTKEAKDIRQQAIEREESYVPQVMSTHKTPITTALTEEVLPKTWDLTKRGAKNLKNAFSDIPKIGQGSGKFKDGKELSVFELKRQKEKYNRMNEFDSVDIPETEDFYSIGKMAQDQVNANSDWSKTWNINTSEYPLSQQISFEAAKNESHWITPTDTFTNTTLERTSAFTAAVSNPANSTTVGGMPPGDTANLAAASGFKTNDTPSYTPLTQSSTAVDSATTNLPAQAQTRAAEVAKADPEVTQWYDLEGEDGGAAAKALWKRNNQPEQVKIDPIEFKDPVQSDLLFRDQRMETGINPLRNA